MTCREDSTEWGTVQGRSAPTKGHQAIERSGLTPMALSIPSMSGSFSPDSAIVRSLESPIGGGVRCKGVLG